MINLQHDSDSHVRKIAHNPDTLLFDEPWS